MTFLQFLNSLFFLLIYPLVIRKLGTENYGTYVFSLSIVTYFIVFISFGFDLPALNKLTKARENVVLKSNIVSEVFTAKLYLFIVSTIIFIFLVVGFRALYDIKAILTIVYLQVILNILMPNWYFQAIQKMNVLTYIQVFSKVLAIPFIFLLVRKPDDLLIFALIITITSVVSGITSIVYIIVKENVSIYLVPYKKVAYCIKESLPFFYSSSASIIRVQGTNILVGSFIGMNGLALYDLAAKVILLPQALSMNINNALFPSIVKNETVEASLIKKIIRYEVLIGVLIVISVIIFGRYAINFLGGANMMEAYPITIILSITILTWVVVSCYMYFLFLPNRLYKIITYNQFWAFAVFFLVALLGLSITHNILVIAMATAIAGVAEIIYCRVMIKKYQLYKE